MCVYTYIIRQDMVAFITRSTQRQQYLHRIKMSGNGNSALLVSKLSITDMGALFFSALPSRGRIAEEQGAHAADAQSCHQSKSMDRRDERADYVLRANGK